LNNDFVNTDYENYAPTLKDLFLREFNNIIDVIQNLVNLGINLTKSDFGIFCSRNENNLNILLSTRNPIFQTGDNCNIDFFNSHNILLNNSKTIASEAHHLNNFNTQILSASKTKHFYISSPIILFNKLFGYSIFFKNNINYIPGEEKLVDNFCSYIGIQIEKLLKKQRNISNELVSEGTIRYDNILTKSIYYFYNIKNNNYYFPDKNLFYDLGYLDYSPEFNIQKIIHPEDLFIFNSRYKIPGNLTTKNLYEFNFRIKDSTGKWRLFCQRDIVYSIDNSGNPLEILSIINELNYENTEIELNEFNSFIKDISNFKNNLDMDSEMTEILDMNIIQNLKDLGGENDSSFLKEVIDLYLDQAPGLLNDIKNAAKDKNPLKMSQSAHALKGASLNIGAKKFSEVCKTLEFKGKNNDLENVNSLLTEMDESYLITSDVLRKLVN